MNIKFWAGKKVFITGHTGFKGSWLSLWLQMLDAKVFGYSLAPTTTPNLFEQARVGDNMDYVFADIRDLDSLKEKMSVFSPDIVIHLAAQPLVRYAYRYPVDTYSTNVMGTVNLFEAVRYSPSVRVVINVTTDKCYENKEWEWGYRENDRLGGYDPYSNSKACSELVTSAYRNSFFNSSNYENHGVSISTARAGNVIGGGDYAADRLVPDVIRAFSNNQTACIRNPNATRPWQHVLEPLRGYLTLAEKMYLHGNIYSQEWNFGPSEEDSCKVSYIVNTLANLWSDGANWRAEETPSVHEANQLKLDISKAQNLLSWRPYLKINDSLKLVIDWSKDHSNSGSAAEVTRNQISNYQTLIQQPFHLNH